MNIESLRREYLLGNLSEENLPTDPFVLFQEWLIKAIDSGIEDATAMALSTIGIDGFPQSRMVLLKSWENESFSFFTNYNSQKAKAIETNNKIALTFFWAQLQRQIRIKGVALKVSNEISDTYFASRPIESKLGAWVSNQSEEVSSRQEIEYNYQIIQKMFIDAPVPRPKYWGGYFTSPISIEFWQGRENRLHDRILYEKTENSWNIKRLAP